MSIGVIQTVAPLETVNVWWFELDRGEEVAALRTLAQPELATIGEPRGASSHRPIVEAAWLGILAWKAH